jgi:hypothetical protein
VSPRHDPDDLLDNNYRAPRPPRRPAPVSPLGRLSELNTRLADPTDPDAPPSRMQRPEDQIGYLVAVAIVVIGIIFTTVHGKGSPKHPHTYLEIAGIVVAGLVPIAIFRYANRFTSAIMVVVSSLFISFVRPPNSWIGLYYLMLIGALGYAFWLTRHQSKMARLQTQAKRTNAQLNRKGAQDRRRGRPSTVAPRAGKGKRDEPTTPPPNRRYTPPQAPRERPKRSEVAAAPPPPTSRRKQRREASEPAGSKESKTR